MTRDAATGFARALVDEWVRAGIADAFLAPGSRSTPLALALARDGRLRLHVHLDERAASFRALGAAKASGRPSVLLCTSGTAGANFHPAVLEARHAHVPLIVCTADRPPELRDTGAGQTVDQVKLYGDAVRWFCEVGVPADGPGAGAWWRSLAARAAGEALGPPAGPVHLNLAFREPLVPTGAPPVEAPGRPDGRPWTAVAAGGGAPDDATVARLADAVAHARRGALVAGWGATVEPAVAARFAAAAGWPVLADPLSGLRVPPHAVGAYDALLRVPGLAAELAPDLVVRLGAPLTGRVGAHWPGGDVPQVLVDPDGAWLDPDRAATERVAADGTALLGAVTDRLESRPAARTPEWAERWRALDDVARRTLDVLLDGRDEPFEGRVARDVVAALPDGSTLVVASSMPVRDVESFAAPRAGVRFLANRGANGIDGFVSTVLGVAAVSDGPVVALCGDLCFLHDAGGLLGSAGLDATFVVVDNAGGGIFSFLPQADAVPEHFETLFATPPAADLGDVARAYGVEVVDVERAADLVPALGAARDAGGLRVLRVRTDRRDNVVRHRRAWAAVAEAVGGSSTG